MISMFLVAAHCVAAWQTGGVNIGNMFPSAAPSTTVTATRSCKTGLRAAASGAGGKSMMETMAGLLAEALGVDSDGAEARFKVGGGGYGGGGGASVGTIDDVATGNKVSKDKHLTSRTRSFMYFIFQVSNTIFTTAVSSHTAVADLNHAQNGCSCSIIWSNTTGAIH